MGHLICFFGNHSERRDWDRFHCRPASGALTCTKSTPNLHGCDNKARRSSGESKITFSLLSLIFVWRFITAQYISFGRIRKGFVGALRTYQRAGPTESGSNVHILDGLFIDPPHVHTGRSASSEAAGRPSSRLHEPTHTGWRKPPQVPHLFFYLSCQSVLLKDFEKNIFLTFTEGCAGGLLLPPDVKPCRWEGSYHGAGVWGCATQARLCLLATAVRTRLRNSVSCSTARRCSCPEGAGPARPETHTHSHAHSHLSHGHRCLQRVCVCIVAMGPLDGTSWHF